jgi:hypothetical protein
MKTELVLFGNRFSMASQIRRRRLVIVFYGIFGALLVAIWLTGSHGGPSLTVWFTLIVGPLLGGYFGGSFNLFGIVGLVEPFSGRKTIVDDDPGLRTDERSLCRRDYAHNLAYRILGTVVSVGFFLEFCNNSSLSSGIEILGLTSNVVNRIVYYLLQICYILFTTLPQAILLWTEPDMEVEG